MNSKKNEIVEQIKVIANKQNFTLLNDYTKPKAELLFKCNATGVVTSTNWSNLKQRGRIPNRNNADYHQYRLEQLCKQYNLTLIGNYASYVAKIKYKCNECNKQYERRLCEVYKCGVCNNFYTTNKGINKTNVLRNPYDDYHLYFVYLPKYNAYKVGLYKSKYIKSRFHTGIVILKVVNTSLYKAYYLEQLIMQLNKHKSYQGEKFGGYTEAFNHQVDINNIMRIMAASVPDVEPRELLENLEADNQQPSFVEIH